MKRQPEDNLQAMWNVFKMLIMITLLTAFILVPFLKLIFR